MKKPIMINLNKDTFNFLSLLSVPCSLDGYRYLACILQNHLEDVCHGIRITDLYNLVGNELGSDGSRCERSLRHMVRKSFKYIKIDDIKNYLIETCDYSNGELPTVGQYLNAVCVYFSCESISLKCISQKRIRGPVKGLNCATEEVKNQDSIELRDHGYWIMNSDRPDLIICSKCNIGFDAWKHEQEYFHFCPNCGKRMIRQNNKFDD